MAKNLTARIVPFADSAETWGIVWVRATGWLGQHPGFLAAAMAGGTPPTCVLVENGRQPVAVMPFLEESRAGSRLLRHVSPAPFGGILVEDQQRLFSDESWRRTIFEAIAEALRPISRATVVFQPGLIDVRPLVWQGWTAAPHYNYISRWDTADAFEKNLSSSARRQVAKARREGLTAHVESDMTSFFALRAATQKRQEFRDPIRPEGYAAMLAFNHHGLRSMAMSVRDAVGRVHAGALYSAGHHRAYYLVGASDPELLGSGAPTLLHVEAIKWMEANAWPRTFDWVGANERGVAQFKSEFNPELEMLLRCEWRGTRARILDAVRDVRRVS